MIGILILYLDSKLALSFRVLRRKSKPVPEPLSSDHLNKIGMRLVSRDACYFKRATSHFFAFHKQTRAVRFRGCFGTCLFIIRKLAESSFIFNRTLC